MFPQEARDTVFPERICNASLKRASAWVEAPRATMHISIGRAGACPAARLMMRGRMALQN